MIGEVKRTHLYALVFQTYHNDIPDYPPLSQRIIGGPPVTPDGDDGCEPHVEGDGHDAALLSQDGEEGERVAPDLQRQASPPPQRPVIENMVVDIIIEKNHYSYTLRQIP